MCLLTDFTEIMTDEYNYEIYDTLTTSQGTTDNRYLFTEHQFDAVNRYW